MFSFIERIDCLEKTCYVFKVCVSLKYQKVIKLFILDSKEIKIKLLKVHKEFASSCLTIKK